MTNKIQKQYHVISEGLNELGVKLVNNHYKKYFESGQIEEGNHRYGYSENQFKIGDKITKRSKRFKQINEFGPESVFEYYDYPVRFGGVNIKLKHLNYKVYEVNVSETFKEISI